MEKLPRGELFRGKCQGPKVRGVISWGAIVWVVVVHGGIIQGQLSGGGGGVKFGGNFMWGQLSRGNCHCTKEPTQKQFLIGVL